MHVFVRLKNCHGYCVFYDLEKCRCKIYKHRPLIYSEQEGVIVDDLCPMKNTVSEKEIKRKGKKAKELLQKMDNETTSLRNTARKNTE